MAGHFSSDLGWVLSRFMARLPTKSAFVLLALGLWIFGCPASSAEDDDPNALNQQVKQLIEEGRYPEAIPLAEKAVELAKRVYGPEHPYTATSLNNLGELRQAMGEYPKSIRLTFCIWPPMDFSLRRIRRRRKPNPERC
jgi:tetratricopeptide (TPR) repeat protein